MESSLVMGDKRKTLGKKASEYFSLEMKMKKNKKEDMS